MKAAQRTRDETATPTARPGLPARHQAVDGDMGNQMLQALVGAGLHPKLEIGGAGDPEEREADQLASSMLSGSRAACACGGSGCAGCGGGGAKVRRKAESAAAPATHVSNAVFGSGGRALDAGTRRRFEPLLGTSLGGVRIHDDPHTSAIARGIGAQAFAVGEHLGFAAGRHQPGTHAGQALIAHELAHVALGHGGVRRRELDYGEGMSAEDAIALRAELDRKIRHHQDWEKGVDANWGADMGRQSKTMRDEINHIDLAVLSSRISMFGAVDKGEGWLSAALKEQGYAGPDIPTVRAQWGEAVIAAEGLVVSEKGDGPDSGARVAALEAIPAFYDGLKSVSVAIEQAHRKHHEDAVAAAEVEYKRELAAYQEELDSLAATLGLIIPFPPAKRTVPGPPSGISPGIDAARERLYAADTDAQWRGVTADVRSLGSGLSKLVAATLPATSEVRQGVEQLEGLHDRLIDFQSKHHKVWRISAVFYPLDAMEKGKDEDGKEVDQPQAIPWQFYLTNTALDNRHMQINTGGQWELRDLTSGKGFKNTAPTSDEDIARLHQGKDVDPPIGLFTELNSSIRFPQGKLFFTLPSGQSYVLPTTAPLTLTEFLEGLGLVLAAIAITAAVVATGGGAAPVAVAFYAGIAAAGVSAAATWSDMQDKELHGILTAADKDAAAISIGLDIISALSMGLGKIVTAPGAAARFGSRFVVLKNAANAAKLADAAGNVYQAYAVTGNFVRQFQAIEAQPLTEDEKKKLRSQLIRRAMLTGAMLTITIKGSVDDVRGVAGLHVNVDPSDSSLVAKPRGEVDVDAHPHADTPSAQAAKKVSTPGEINDPAHAASQRAGADMAIGPKPHSVAATGQGKLRDFYICSDLCGPILDKLRAAAATLPPGHPEQKLFNDMMREVRKAQKDLKAGKLTQDQADAFAGKISDDIARLSQHTRHFGPLMNTETSMLLSERKAIRDMLSSDLGLAEVRLGNQQAAQKMARTPSKPQHPDEPGARSASENDMLAGFDMQIVDKANKRLQKLRFDAGNFSHANAEALVPGLPRGLSPEVTIELPDGTIGRADRVGFVTDPVSHEVIGAHVYEIKPNTDYWRAEGQVQADNYMRGLQAKIEADLKAKGVPVPTQAPDGGPLFSARVMTYDQQQMLSVMRAVRQQPRDAARMAEYEALAREVFGKAAK